MIPRRSFFVFFPIRLSAWVFWLVVLSAIGSKLFEQADFLPLVGSSLFLLPIGFVLVFFEFDSLPRAVGWEDGRRVLVLRDASGEEFRTRDFVVKRHLWLTRLVFVQERRLKSVPLEAYRGGGALRRTMERP